MRGLNLCLAASKCTCWKQGQRDVNVLFVTYECYEGQAKAISYWFQSGEGHLHTWIPPFPPALGFLLLKILLQLRGLAKPMS